MGKVMEKNRSSTKTRAIRITEPSFVNVSLYTIKKRRSEVRSNASTDVWVEVDTVESDEHQILKLFEDGRPSLIAADIAELSGILADDYLQ